MDNEKTNEFKNYLKEVISGNAQDVLGSRAVLNTIQSKKIATISGIMKIPSDEEIIIFFDDTITGSGKKGLLLTSWGIHYEEWNMSWEEMAEKYNIFAIEDWCGSKKLKIQNGHGNNLISVKEIFLTFAYFDIEWLKRILITGCRIFTGKEICKEETVIPAVSNNSVPPKPEAAISEAGAETKKLVINNEIPKTASGTSARTSGEGVVVYKDWKMIVFATISIIAAPIFGIYSGISDGNFGSSNHIIWLIICCVFSVVCFFYHKYLRGGIIIDLNARVISFPKVDLFAFFKPYPRNDISFDDITQIQAINKAEIEGNIYFKIIMTYKFVIHGTFGSKTVSFRSREKRDQFYSLLATYGNFS